MPLTQKSFSDLITFTRSTGGGRFNAAGQYEWLPANTPRIDYDPVTGECRGLLIEEQRTNLIPRSDTSAGSWTGGGDRVLGAATGLPGVFAVGASLVRDASANTFNYYQALTPVAGTTYTFSVFVRFADGRDVGAEFGQPGTENSPLNPFSVVANGSAYTWSAITKEHVGGGLWRLSHTVTPSDTITRGWGILIRHEHKAGLPRLFVTGHQLEVGGFPTSLIHTEGAQVTRAADIASVNELSPWFNPEQGTLVADFELIPGRSAQGVIVSFGINNSIQTMIGTQAGNYPTLLQVGNYNVGDTNIPSSVFPGRNKAGLYYEAGTLRGAANSFLSAGSTSKVPNSSTTRMHLGTFAGHHTRVLNGWLRGVRFYPKALSDTELQAMTQ